MEASSSESSITSMPVDHNMSDVLRPSFSEISVSDIDSFAIHSESSEISTVEPSLSESNNVSLADSTITNSQQLVSPQLWNEFRIIGDNIDKNVKPRFYKWRVKFIFFIITIVMLYLTIDLSAASDSRPAKVCS